MKSSRQMVEEATRAIETLSRAEAATLLDNPDVVFVDIREPREIERDGAIPGAFNAPRGMLEFWVDPESPYHKPVFASGKRFVFYCASAWRSSLATLVVQTMGLPRVCQLDGGFSAWKADGLPMAAPTADAKAKRAL
jgi:rhodanese-related sulfurtransferase